jgi:hypothetical protein
VIRGKGFTVNVFGVQSTETIECVAGTAAVELVLVAPTGAPVVGPGGLSQ